MVKQGKRHSSRGHLQQRSPGSWTVWVSAGVDPATGKRRRMATTVRGTKRDAERKLTEMLATLDKGTYLKPTKITVADFLRQWLDSYVAANLRARTWEGYRLIVERRLIPGLGAIPLADLRPSHIQDFYAKALSGPRLDGRPGKVSARTILGHHRVLKEALSHAVKWELCVRNAADAVEPPRAVAVEMKTLDEEGIERFLEVVRPTQYYSLFLLDFHTGLRRSELLALRWRDLDLNLATLSVTRGLHRLRDGRLIFEAPKSKRGKRQVALGPTAVLALRAHRDRREADLAVLGAAWDEDAPVFPRPDGSPLFPDTISHVFIKFLRKAGLEGVRLHDVRHSHATLLLKQGVHPRVAMERLGHATVATTIDLYSHTVPGLQEAAALSVDKALAKRRTRVGAQP